MIATPNPRSGGIGRWLAGLMALGFLADPIAGVSAWLQVEKAMVRKEVRRHIISGLDKNGLVLLEFSRTETEPLLRWEHAGEFEYDGQMYDIVDSWIEGDTVYYRCFWDRAETRLNEQLRELAVRSHGAAPKFGGTDGFGSSTLRSPVFLVTREWQTPPPRSLSRRPAGFSNPFSSRTILLLTPPPWPA